MATLGLNGLKRSNLSSEGLESILFMKESYIIVYNKTQQHEYFTVKECKKTGNHLQHMRKCKKFLKYRRIRDLNYSLRDEYDVVNDWLSVYLHVSVTFVI